MSTNAIRRGCAGHDRCVGLGRASPGSTSREYERRRHFVSQASNSEEDQL